MHNFKYFYSFFKLKAFSVVEMNQILIYFSMSRAQDLQKKINKFLKSYKVLISIVLSEAKN
jgi:hypothetical protein